MKQTDTESTSSSLKAELAKIRSLPRGKRLEYIWEYYRLTFFLVAFGLFFLWMLGSFLVNSLSNTLFPKDTVSIAFAAPGFVNNQEWMDRCLAAIDFDEKNEDLNAMSTVPLNDTRDDFRLNAAVWLANGQPDIFVADDRTCQYLLELEALADLTEVWPEELQALAESRMVSPYCLEISDTPFAQAYGLGDSPVYLCMYQHGSGFVRALDIVGYILAEA